MQEEHRFRVRFDYSKFKASLSYTRPCFKNLKSEAGEMTHYENVCHASMKT